MKRHWVAWLAATIVVVALLGLGVVGWIGSERAIHPKAAYYKWSLSDYPDLHPQTVSFVSRTGVTIVASFFPGERRETIVLSHGYGDNRKQMTPWAEFLHRHGYTVLAYDMRDRGDSGGDAVTLGALEKKDLVSAVDYLTKRPEVDADRIGALGLSLGASTTILAAAEDPRIKAVVEDSGFSDAPNVINTSFEHFIGLPPFPFAPITIAIAGRRVGQDINSVRPMDEIARISPRPLLVIHCRGDKVVPPENSERNFKAARDPKEIWWLPTGGHIEGHTIAPAEYEQRVNEFFDRTLHPAS